MKMRRMWRVGLVACLLVIMRTAGAQTPTRFVTEYQMDRDEIEIPFEYRQRQIVIHGDADDRKDLTLIFDSGATSPVFDTALGLKGFHLADSVVKEAEGSSKAETIWLSKLRLGSAGSSVLAHNLPVLITDISQIGKALNIKLDGVVGLSFMAGYVVEIDYGKHVLRFYHPRNYSVAQKRPDNQRTFLLDLMTGIPQKTPGVHLKGKLHDKYEYDFLLDTGFGGYVSVAQSAAQEAGLFRADTPRIASISQGVSHRFRSFKIRAGFLMLGDINLSGRVIQVDIRNNDEYGQGGIIGNRLLQNYRVTLDCPRHKLWLERVTGSEEPDEAERPVLGIAIRTNSVKVTIERVTKNSPADLAGVRPGDVLASINGLPVRELTTVQVANLLASPKGATTLAFTRGAHPENDTGGDFFSMTLMPSSPLDWEPPHRVR